MWSKVGMGGEHHRYYKHTKFCQNPRSDPKFLVDLTQNDPVASQAVVTQVVLFHNIKPSLAISHHITYMGRMGFLTKYIGLLPMLSELPCFLGRLSAEVTWNAEVVD